MDGIKWKAIHYVFSGPAGAQIKKAVLGGLTPVFETGVKTPFKQPIADSLSVIGCLVWFEYE
ncbi:hypothetical protein MOD51_16345, partial [Bacillus inaquosorum]|nr:hypothetical protein [Bacillus inaquosorum]